MFSSYTPDLFQVMQVLVTDRRHQAMGLGKLGSFEAISSHSDIATFPLFFPSAIFFCDRVVRSAGSLPPRVYGV